MTEQPHILVIDDDPSIRALLLGYLVEEGYRVSDAPDGAAARAVIEREAIDLVLLDLMMPGENGFSLARHIRRNSDVPIIMLTGKEDVIDRVAGLEAGADDYIVKPFHLREVLARIRTVMRRVVPQPKPSSAAMPRPKDTGEALVFDGWQLHLIKRELLRPDGMPVLLTAAEFDLLRVFASHPNRVLSRGQLMDLVKGHDWAAYDRAVDAQVVRLRKKIEPEPRNPILIKTVRGAGYVFAAAVTAI